MNFKQLHPTLWAGWLIIAIAWCITRLPLTWQFCMGRQLGKLAYRLGGRRLDITRTNIRLCFPERSQAEQDKLVKGILVSTGISVIETALAWFKPASFYSKNMKITGLDLLEAAQKKGKGVLLVGAHFATLDIAGALLGSVSQLDVIYRKNKNSQIDQLMCNGRKRNYQQLLERKNTRQILRRLKQGATIWYAADQDYGKKHSVFVPFFGIEAASITATTRFANFNDSPVLFFSHYRNAGDQTWFLEISSVESYPGDNPKEDAQKINAIIEQKIRKHPEQYLWLHRRFKSRPEGEAGLYGDTSRSRSR